MDIKNREFLEQIKDGGFFTILNSKKELYIIGYLTSFTLDEYDDGWHQLQCAFLYNSLTSSFRAKDTCGCHFDNTIRKPTLDEFRLLTYIMALRGYKFNRKRKKLEKLNHMG